MKEPVRHTRKEDGEGGSWKEHGENKKNLLMLFNTCYDGTLPEKINSIAA